MNSNNIDVGKNGDPEGKVSESEFVNRMPEISSNEGSYALKIFRSSLNILAHILIGVTVGISLLFSFARGIPLGTTMLHIVLCVIGFQLLMSEAILSLCPYNGWSNYLRLADKKRAHTILQVVGSVLALAGCFVMVLAKNVNFNTLHGQFALVAMVFTVASLFNGLTSWYAFELRKCLPGNLSKITHIVFGIVAYAMSAISLCYGFNKGSFKNWASPDFTYTLIAFTGCFTLICIITPIFTFFEKSIGCLRR
ncbi:unnamed protein product [Danaus chrysippus]|uniref:ascorbate ferrireductase (transmembrane) n=1 Tax=Danaus chrysippus TaxID=151541 RepID=A0A8J2R3K7_9NEOP|nr:unnamed protein product [Danaus chrysippus]